MKRKSSGVECDQCGWSVSGGALIPFRYYKKPCPSCGGNLLGLTELALWVALNFLVMISLPIDFILGKIFRTKSESFRIKL